MKIRGVMPWEIGGEDRALVQAIHGARTRRYGPPPAVASITDSA